MFQLCKHLLRYQPAWSWRHALWLPSYTDWSHHQHDSKPWCKVPCYVIAEVQQTDLTLCSSFLFSKVPFLEQSCRVPRLLSPTLKLSWLLAMKGLQLVLCKSVRVHFPMNSELLGGDTPQNRTKGHKRPLKPPFTGKLPFILPQIFLFTPASYWKHVTSLPLTPQSHQLSISKLI